MEVGDGVFEVKATSGDTRLGGDDFDKRIVDWLAEEFLRDQGIDLLKDRQALQRLTEAAEKSKIELSSVVETSVSLPFITADASGPKHMEYKLSRAKFEQLAADLVERCTGPVKQALADAKLPERDIDEVVLVGNYRKRIERDRAQTARAGKRELILALLDVMDDLERALAHAGQEPAPVVEGLRAIYRRLTALLAAQGVTAFESLGRTFDPALHEAVGSVESDEQEPRAVSLELQPGYR